MNCCAPAPGDAYLVDVGKLVPVAAVNPRNAFWMAVTGILPVPEHAEIYQFGPAGELLAVYA